MRNKGFFWFLTILLTVICVYQLSFTFVSNGVEKKAEKEATTKVEELKKLAFEGDTTEILPNGVVIDFNNPEAEEIAKSAYINDILKNKAEKAVYPLFGSSFKEVKKRSLAFGLDLVGGMSVTVELSIPELVKNYARNKNEAKFKKVHKAALAEYGKNGGDFISIFVAKHNELNPDMDLVRLFAISDIDELKVKSTDEEVVDFLKGKESVSMDGVSEILSRRINQFGVAQPNIQKDPTNNRLYIELPGVQDEVTVAERIQASANLEFFENFTFDEIGGYLQEAIARSADTYNDITIDEEIDTNEVADAAGVDTDDVDTNGINDLASLESLTEDNQSGLGKYLMGYSAYSMAVKSEDKLAVVRILKREDIQAIFPESLKFMWSSDMEIINSDTKELGYLLYAIRVPANGKARVGGTDIASADAGYDQEEGEITVDIQMTSEGADKWGQMTTDNQGLVVSITMDNLVYSAPRVNDPILSGRTQISGNFTINEANDLKGLLNGGSLPAPIVIKEQTKVGPTIGAENSRSGLMSFGFALLLVFVYMVFYYGKAGIIADIALFANILFIFGSLASFGAVLTLAGIAGIVLTIGMAVDANVLIFERIREEQAAGKDVKAAVDTGFKKALSSIIDANVTTLLTAIVLKSFGSGPIESFATTLIIGIFTSVFAALVITRLLMLWWMNKGKGINFETKLTKGAFKNFNFNFVGKRKMFYLISGILVAGSLVALFSKGLNPSVEFSGGRSYGVKFEKKAGDHTDAIRKNLQAFMVDTDGKKASVELKTKESSYYLEITTNFMLADESVETSELVKKALRDGLKKSEVQVGSFEIMESRSVSSSVSEELISSSMLAIILSLIIIFAYILMRFGRWQYSTGAIIAMMHDVILVLGAFALFHGILPFNMDVDQAFVAAILTVIGYSINDTVVVFDRIREDLTLHPKANEEEQINKSLNSTLSRTINTSMTTFIVLLIVFLFGGAAIKGFIFALMIGVIVGTYSSLCIATPVLIDFSRKKLIEDKQKAIDRKEELEAIAIEKASLESK
ncbi:MAG: protein translocase subunit SecDF [Fluviicola sp.]|nr:protein translocase subunit SecDF [Fluviicola sp.]